MSNSTQILGITLTATGDQTGSYLTNFNADKNNTPGILWGGIDMSPDGFNAEGPFTYGVSAKVADGTGNPLQNTSTIGHADNLAIQAGCVNIHVNNFNGALASAADNAYLQSFAAGVLLDTWGNNDTVLANNSNDTVAAGGSGDRLTISGANATIALDTNFSGFVTQTEQVSDAQRFGTKATIIVGDGNSSDVPTGPASVELDLHANNLVYLQSPVGQETLVMHDGGNTVQASAGSDTIYATSGNDVINNYGAQLLFVGAASGGGGLDPHGDINRNDGTYFGTVGMSTINGVAGNSTVFAKAGVVFNEGGGNNVFIGGNVADLTALNHGSGGNFIGQPQPSPDKPLQDFHSTVVGGSSGYNLLFGGTVGDDYQPGSATNLFINGGGSDTISGGTSAAIVFGSTNGSDKLVNTTGAILVAGGSNEIIDTSAGNQGNTFYVNNSASVGNTTLVGSSAAPTNLFDKFVISNSGGGAAAHTLTIGFHTGDAVFLSGYSMADNQTFANAVDSSSYARAADIRLGAPPLAVTLSDHTTIQFINAHPTAAFDGGMVAI